MLTLTDKAQGKVKEIIDSQPEPFAGLRVQVVGGGCSGFQYHMGFEKQGNSGDEVLEMGGFKVFVDRGSSMYLDGTEIDWVALRCGLSSSWMWEIPTAGSRRGWSARRRSWRPSIRATRCARLEENRALLAIM